MKAIYLTFLFLAFTNIAGLPALAQDHHHESDHHDHEHTHLLNEIGMAVGPVFVVNEEEVGTGLHLHYTRTLKKQEKLGLGAGLEMVFSDHSHYTASVMFVYRPIHPLWMSVGPGITYFDESRQTGFSLHLETGYEFDVKIVHIGPMVEYAFSGSEHHFMIGLHIGYPF